jgi:hypothetical protein
VLAGSSEGPDQRWRVALAPASWESVADALGPIPVNVDSFHRAYTQVTSEDGLSQLCLICGSPNTQAAS